MNIEKQFFGEDKPIRKLVEYKKLPVKEKEIELIKMKESREEILKSLERKAISLPERQKKILKIAYSELDKYSEEYGLNKDVFRKVKLFFLPPEIFNKLIGPELDGMYGIEPNAAVVKYSKEYERNKDLILWLNLTIHELIHSRSYQAMQIYEGVCEEEKEFCITRSRLGPYITKAGEKGVGSYFGWLNEALTVSLSNKITEQIVNQCEELFPEKIEQFKKAKRKINCYTSVEPKYYKFYPKILDKLIKELAGKEEKSQKDISKVFYQTLFTSKLLPLARMIERNYGPGSFRVLANIDEENWRNGLKYASLKLSLQSREELAKKIIQGREGGEEKVVRQEYEHYKKYQQLRKNLKKDQS